MTAAPVTLDGPHAIRRPLYAPGTAYALRNTDDARTSPERGTPPTTQDPQTRSTASWTHGSDRPGRRSRPG